MNQNNRLARPRAGLPPCVGNSGSATSKLAIVTILNVYKKSESVRHFLEK